jgi:hypothetical protein
MIEATAIGQVIQDDVSLFGMRRVHVLCCSEKEAEWVLDGWMEVALSEGGNGLWTLKYEEKAIGVWHVRVGWKPRKG